ncbi:MAG: biotin--[acetyl-CoA-carboxylase] ligase [Oscillospiraceae bacterium]
MKDQILELLRREPGYLSGQEMSNRLGVSRAAVWKAVEALRKGYTIDSAPNRGYRLNAPTGRLSLREISARLEDHPWASLVQVLDCVDSTNNLAKTLAAQGAPAGTVVIAERQTGGRGRLGRGFSSPPGMGVYLSVILRPDAPPERLMHLTCAVAEVLCDGVEAASGLRPGIKWTNDLVSGGRKLCGILTELSLEAESGHVQYAVVGAGVNCGQKLSDFPPEIQDIAGSLTMLTGKPVDRNTLAAEMIRSLSRLDGSLVEHREQWMDRYRRDCVTIGRAVSVSRAGETRWGQAVDVDGWGALLVDFGQGPEAVHSGEVSVRGMYGYV